MDNKTQLLEIAKEAFLNSQFNVHRFRGESVVEITHIDHAEKTVTAKITQDNDRFAHTSFNIRDNNDGTCQLIYGTGYGSGRSKSFSKDLIDIK